MDRVLKCHPELGPLPDHRFPRMPGIPGARRISNRPLSPTAGETAPFSTLLAVASGVPQSFPFHSLAVHFHAPEFGECKTRVLVYSGNLARNFVDRELVGGRPRTIARGVHIPSRSDQQEIAADRCDHLPVTLRVCSPWRLRWLGHNPAPCLLNCDRPARRRSRRANLHRNWRIP